MNKYDKKMMHERELIYDAKGHLHRADMAYKKGDKKAKQTMIHDRELVYDAKGAIHRTDVEKKDRSSIAKHWHKNAQVYIMESNKQERKNLLKDMPIDNRGSALNYGKPTSPVAMRMADTKSGLPMKESPVMMYDKSPMKMYDKSPMAMRETPLMKALVGNQDRLPENLQKEILKK